MPTSDDLMMVKDEWNTTCCSDCMVGGAPEPWKSHGDAAWNEPVCCDGCPCDGAASNMEALGMFEDPSPIPGPCRSYGCCKCLFGLAGLPVIGGIIAGPCAGPFLYCTFTTAEEKMGIKPTGCLGTCCKTLLIPASTHQIQRELIIRGMHPKAKKEDELPGAADDGSGAKV